MPSKRPKRSVREANTKAAGADNPPTAADSLIPMTTNGQVHDDSKAGVKRNNKRRKSSTPAGGNGELSGVSKGASRVINAIALREEHHAKKKRKLEEADKGKNPNQKAKPAMTPLPYESLSSFNRRVEQDMRSGVRTAIKEAGAASKKKKAAKKVKAAKEAAAGEDAPEDFVEEDPDKAPKFGAKANVKKPKPTPEESVDPFAKKDTSGRSGKTEFDVAPQRRGIIDVVQAPPTLARPARKNLLEKVLGPGGSASDGSIDAGGMPTFRMKGAEEAVGHSRLPIDPAMKMLLDAERERAVKMYRELKEKKEKEKEKVRV